MMDNKAAINSFTTLRTNAKQIEAMCKHFNYEVVVDILNDEWFNLSGRPGTN